MILSKAQIDDIEWKARTDVTLNAGQMGAYLRLIAHIREQEKALEAARETIESIESRGRICFDCEVNTDEEEYPESGYCRVHQLTREWLLKYPRG